MVKGDTALDMRGRCSAGQKVMALCLQYTATGMLKPAHISAQESSDQNTGSSSSNLLLCTTSLHSLWVSHTQYVTQHLTPALGCQNPLFQMGTGLMPCRSEGFDFLCPQVQVLPFCLFLVTTEVTSASGLSTCFLFFFFSLCAVGLFAPASTSKLIGSLLLQIMLLSPAADCSLSEFMAPISHLAILPGIVFPPVLSACSSMGCPFLFSNTHWPGCLVTQQL